MPEASVSSLAIYQLRVVPCGVSPLVWRRLLVASETSLVELHEILQIAFDWSGQHLHRFLIRVIAESVPNRTLRWVNLSLLPSIKGARAYVGLPLTRRQPALWCNRRSATVREPFSSPLL